MTAKLSEALRAAMPGAVIGEHTRAGDDTVILRREALLPAMTWLRDDAIARMDMLVDVTAVDCLGLPAEARRALSPLAEGEATARFEVVYYLLSLALGHRLRVKVLLEADDAEVPSLVPLWKAANWGEREVWDMFGIRFAGHPDLRRILLYEEFQGHPLRKDYPQRGHQPLVPMPGLADYAGDDVLR
jgi:NADH-quinone oxidoreductase subunit C